MNYGDLKTHFEAVLNRSDITSALTTTFIGQGIAEYSVSFVHRLMSERLTTQSQARQLVILPNDF